MSSMGYPGSYSNKARCQWTIQVPLGKLVHLHFHNFSLEESQHCLNDKVSITDRLGSLGMLISASFGSQTSVVICHSFLVWFMTDAEGEKAGSDKLHL